MAWIKTRDTTRRERGKPVKAYVVLWKEVERDAYGLPVPVNPDKPTGRKRTTNRQETFATRVEAEARRDELNAERRQPGGVRTVDDKLFAVAAEEWLASRTDLKASTRAEYENLLKPKTRANRGLDGQDTRHLSVIATFGGKALTGITRQQIATWVDDLVAAGKKPSTVRHSYFVVKMGLTPANYLDAAIEAASGLVG